jgi:acetyltransferase-like isoleucine patch superfamily enzyme
MSDLVIFGLGELGELAEFYFTHDSDHDVVGFTVDGAYVREDHFRGKPVVPFEAVTTAFPPDRAHFFVAVGYARINALRGEKVAAAKGLGYVLASYLSSRATVFTNFELKDNCFILENNTIQPFASIGANVTLWSGNHIGHHSIIEDNVFIASHVVAACASATAALSE